MSDVTNNMFVFVCFFFVCLRRKKVDMIHVSEGLINRSLFLDCVFILFSRGGSQNYDRVILHDGDNAWR